MHHGKKLGRMSTQIRMISIGVLLASLWLSMPAHAETIYRWIGSGGVVNYGETPPAGARGVQQIAGAPQQSVSAPAATAKAPVPLPLKPRAERSPSRAPEDAARKQLAAELVAARLQLLQATKNYEQGKNIRTGNERNYARYLDRVNGLRQAMDSAKLRVLLLQHQLSQTQEVGSAPPASQAVAH